MIEELKGLARTISFGFGQLLIIAVYVVFELIPEMVRGAIQNRRTKRQQ